MAPQVCLPHQSLEANLLSILLLPGIRAERLDSSLQFVEQENLKTRLSKLYGLDQLLPAEKWAP